MSKKLQVRFVIPGPRDPRQIEKIQFEFRHFFKDKLNLVGVIESRDEFLNCTLLDAEVDVLRNAIVEKFLLQMQVFCGYQTRLRHISYVFRDHGWFSTELISEHAFVEVSAVRFGSLIMAPMINNISVGNVFHCHWPISARMDDHRGNSFHAWTISTTFEYDNKCIDIFAKECKPNLPKQMKSQEKYQNDGYKIKIFFDSLVRVIVNEQGSEKFRICFLVRYPPQLYETRIERSDNGPAKTLSFRVSRLNDSFERCISTNAINENSYIALDIDCSDNTIYEIVSRLHVCNNLPVEICNYTVTNSLISNRVSVHLPDKEVPYNDRKYLSSSYTWTHEDDRFQIFKKQMYKLYACKKEVDDAQYLIEALLSRGANVKDCLFLAKSHWEHFLNVIVDAYKYYRETALEGLRRLHAKIEEVVEVHNITHAYKDVISQLVKSNDINYGLNDKHKDMGYMLVKKVIITPTRVLLYPQEMTMGNRVLRKYEHMLRVSFKEDDTFRKMAGQTGSLVKLAVESAFNVGIVVTGDRYFYLGSSSSQQREHGAFFMLLQTMPSNLKMEPRPENSKDPQRIIDFRNELGKFDVLENIPRLMARLGQCFSQSRELRLILNRLDYDTGEDVIGGRKYSGYYTFSDGVGYISGYLLKLIACELKLNSVPACIQFRFRGMKGVLVHNPQLDEIAGWGEKYQIPPPRTRSAHSNRIGGSWRKECIFMPSQTKFETNSNELGQKMEIVKYSGPTGVSLNKPLICVMEQVSQQQSFSSHCRIMERIKCLLNRTMTDIALCLFEENTCRRYLNNIARKIDVSLLPSKLGFDLVNEPFYRSLVKASVLYCVKKQLKKLQIQVPEHLGRSMLGVIDCSGQLQSGQVFVQYTRDCRHYDAHANSVKIVLTGKVMLTKSPTTVKGDVRMFEAVDIPQLHHLVDVVVFPSHGPRPHPDEMAGSDLDGDEYSVIWDQELMIDRNEKPNDFVTRALMPEQMDPECLIPKCAQFFLESVKMDRIGTLSNSHLFNADLYGLDAPVCQSLAQKCIETLDYNKTGVGPERSTDKVREDADGNEMAPERPPVFPDFNGRGNGRSLYRSIGASGYLYREVEHIENLFSIADENEQTSEIHCDPMLEQPYWQSYESIARKLMHEYSNKIKSIMSIYGVETEAELFTGDISSMKNSYSDNDNQSFYNTKHTVEERVNSLFKEFREDFFEEFGGWRSVTEPKPSRFIVEVNSVTNSFCFHPSDNMRQKASAYYMVAYQEAKKTTNNRILSFAWIAYDVLADVRRTKLINSHNQQSTTQLVPVNSNPIKRKIEAIVETYRLHHPKSLSDFVESISLRRNCRDLALYLKHYKGLDEVCFFIARWGTLRNVFSHDFNIEHMLYVFLLYITDNSSATNQHYEIHQTWFLEPVEEIRKNDGTRAIFEHGADFIIGFFEYVASYDFKNREHLLYAPFHLQSVFMRGEWIAMHEAAKTDFYLMVYAQVFDLNPSERSNSLKVREWESFVICLPEGTDLQWVKQKIISVTGVKDVALRILKTSDTTMELSCLTRATLLTLKRLKDLVIPPLSFRGTVYSGDVLKKLSILTLRNIEEAKKVIV